MKRFSQNEIAFSFLTSFFLSLEYLSDIQQAQLILSFINN
jgi:hypothetical protein